MLRDMLLLSQFFGDLSPNPEWGRCQAVALSTSSTNVVTQLDEKNAQHDQGHRDSVEGKPPP